jgi:hypothetical protein
MINILMLLCTITQPRISDGTKFHTELANLRQIFKVNEYYFRKIHEECTARDPSTTGEKH